MKKSIIVAILLKGGVLLAQTPIISTVAGCGQVGGAGSNGDGGPATSGKFTYPYDIAYGANGTFYMSDGGAVRVVDNTGTINTISGVTGGRYVACDKHGNLYTGGLYKRDTLGNVTHIAGGGSTLGDGGPALSAQLTDVTDVAFDTSGNIFLCDNGANRIRKIAPNGTISTYAGTGTAGYSGDGGPATSAKLNYPYRVACDKAGNLYIADAYNNVIRKVDLLGTITTFAGDGTGAGNPAPSGSYAGDGGLATAAKLNYPIGLTVNPADEVVIADTYNNRIRKVNHSGIITTIAGGGNGPGIGDGGPATSAVIGIPNGVDYDRINDNLYISDYNDLRMRKVSFNFTEGVSDSEAHISIYPNPFTSEISLKLNKNVSYSIFNSLGALVCKGNSQASGARINLNEQAPGIYFLLVEGHSYKLIKE